MIAIFSSNGNEHTISDEEFKELRFTIADKYGKEFYTAYKKYYEKIDDFNVITMSDAMHNVIKAVNDNLELFNFDLNIVEFLTSNRTYTLDSKHCGEVAEKIVNTEIGNREKTNLPTFYIFFRHAADKKLTITWMSANDRIKHLETEYYNKYKDYCNTQVNND